MRVCSKRLLLAGAVLATACLGGCGRRGPETVPVMGQVTFEGQPIKEGRIRFFPAEGTAGPVTGAEIREGRYEVRNRGGVPVGRHRVEIEAFRLRKGGEGGESEPELPGAGSAAVEQFIPEEYNRQSELSMTVESGSGKKTFDFDLTK